MQTTYPAQKPHQNNQYQNQKVKSKVNRKTRQGEFISETFWFIQFNCGTFTDKKMLDVFRNKLFPVTLYEWKQQIK